MEKITDTISTTSSVIEVKFHETGRSFFFGSLAAIFELFTPEEVGCKLYRLWGHVDFGKAVSTAQCLIMKRQVFRKSNKSNNQ